MSLETILFVVMFYGVFLNSSSLLFFTSHAAMILDTEVVFLHFLPSERTVGKA